MANRARSAPQSLCGGGVYNAYLYRPGKRPIERAVIRVDHDGRVSDVSEQDTSTATSGLIDGAGRFFFPGFIDCNTHLTLTGGADPHGDIDRPIGPETRAEARLFAERTLRGGVTRVRDLGGIEYQDIELRNFIRRGVCIGPRMQAAGKLICRPGGHGNKAGREAAGAQEMRRAVSEQIDRGADVIKLIASGGVLTESTEPQEASFTEAELRAAVETAHRYSRRVTAHSHGVESTLRAVAAGVDSIEHGVFIDQRCMDVLATAGCPLVSTLCAPSRVVEGGTDAGVPRHVLDRMRDIQNIHAAAIGKAHDAGVQIVMGSDAGSPLNRHGDNLRELRYLSRAGLSFASVIESATIHAAALLGVADHAGSIDIGKVADMTVFRIDPATCPERLGDPDLLDSVVRGGTVFTRADTRFGQPGDREVAGAA